MRTPNIIAVSLGHNQCAQVIRKKLRMGCEVFPFMAEVNDSTAQEVDELLYQFCTMHGFDHFTFTTFSLN